MKLLDRILPTPAENLAVDEALLMAAELGDLDDDVLRLWEMPTLSIVVGRSSRIEAEVNTAAAETMNASIVRRACANRRSILRPR